MAKVKRQQNEAETLATALGLSFKEFQIDGETITVRKFKLKAMAPVYQVLTELSAAAMPGEMNAGQLIAAFPELAAKMIAFATDKSVEWAGNLEIEDAGELLAATMEINNRFFTGEAMARMFDSLGKAFVQPQMTTATASPN